MKAPTIIIGVGGTGCRIVNNLSGRIKGKLRENALFFCFDTDVNDIVRLQHIEPDNVFQTSTSRKVGTYLKVDPEAREWFPDSYLLNEHNLTQGAAQFRVISRLALRSAIKDKKLESLSEQVRLLLINNQSRHDTTPRVFVITTLAGGTGAGIFLQIGMILRSIFKDHGPANQNFFGICILPDIIVQSSDNNLRDLNNDQKSNMVVNGYASMKELMAIYKHNSQTFGSDSFRLILEHSPDVGKVDHNELIPSDIKPFDFVFLFDRSGRDGRNLGNGTNPYYQQVEDLVFLLSSSEAGERSLSITNNELFKIIRENGLARFAASAISRLVYPVEDVARFCALKWIAGNISEQWSEIDKRFSILLKEYTKAKLMGKELPKPDRAQHYIQTLPVLAKDNRSGRLFARLYNGTLVRSNDGQFGPPKSSIYLKNVEDLIAEQFIQNPRAKYFQEKKLNTELLTKDEIGADNEVASFERYLYEYEAFVNELVNTAKINAISAILPDTEYKQALRKAKVDITAFFADKEEPMHPVSARYCLYQLGKMIDDKIKVLNEEVQGLEGNLARYKETFDDKSTEMTDSPLDRLRAAKTQNWLKKLGKNEYKRFIEEYIQKSSRQKTNIGKYANAKTRQLVYIELLAAINLISGLYENFFDSLPTLEADLLSQSQILNDKHHDNPDVSNVFVLSDKNYEEVLVQGKSEKDTIKLRGYKEKIWSERRAYYNDDELPPEVLSGIFYMIYDIAIEAIMTNKLSGYATSALLNIKDEFRKVVVPEAVEKLLKDPEINLDLVQALRKEAALNKKYKDEDIREYISERLGGISRLAAHPYIQFNPDLEVDSLTKFQFWGINEKIKNSIPNNAFSNAQVITDQSFDQYTIIYANMSVCFKLDNVSAFNDGSNSYGAGRYYNQYKDRIRKVNTFERGLLRDCPAYFSPHLDKRWHKRSYLPEISNSFDELQDEAAREAFLLGLVYGEFLNLSSQNTRSGFEWIQFDDRTNQVLLQDEYGKAVDGRLYDLITYLYDNAEVVEEVLNSKVRPQYNNDNSSGTVTPLSERGFYKGSLEITYQNKPFTLLDIICMLACEQSDDSGKKLSEKLILEWSAEIENMIKRIFGEQRQKCKEAYDGYFRELKEKSTEFNKLEPGSKKVWGKWMSRGFSVS